MLLLSSSGENQPPAEPWDTSPVEEEEHNALLIALVDAALGDQSALAEARDAVRCAMGDEALVDAAGVVGAFQAYNRIVDATGVPLDTVFSAMTKDLQEKHGFERFSSARESDIAALLSTVHRVSAPVARWLLRKGMSQAQRML